MKIQITQHNETYTIESDEDINCAEMLDHAYNLLQAIDSDAVREAIYDKADELGSEEGFSMQPNDKNT